MLKPIGSLRGQLFLSFSFRNFIMFFLDLKRIYLFFSFLLHKFKRKPKKGKFTAQGFGGLSTLIGCLDPGVMGA